MGEKEMNNVSARSSLTGYLVAHKFTKRIDNLEVYYSPPYGDGGGSRFRWALTDDVVVIERITSTVAPDGRSMPYWERIHLVPYSSLQFDEQGNVLVSAEIFGKKTIYKLPMR